MKYKQMIKTESIPTATSNNIRVVNLIKSLPFKQIAARYKFYTHNSNKKARIKYISAKTEKKMVSIVIRYPDELSDTRVHMYKFR